MWPLPIKRIKCGWGEWSLVQATLYAVEAALVGKFPRATHFYMLSGDCHADQDCRVHVHNFLDDQRLRFHREF